MYIIAIVYCIHMSLSILYISYDLVAHFKLQGKDKKKNKKRHQVNIKSKTLKHI